MKVPHAPIFFCGRAVTISPWSGDYIAYASLSVVEKCIESHHRSCWDFDSQSALMLFQLLLGRLELRQVDVLSYVKKKKNTAFSAQLYTLKEVGSDCSQDVLRTLSEVSFLRQYVHVCSHSLILLELN